ncbi:MULTISPECIES: ArgP/LysG family DNA-binding transcriptional regulator [Kocuria]|uniref:ArgP/LysG family DNA-binding transcriptional regulator n=1 Tax=Kocuria subflava TaxID=1736139 RepID=A0A846TTF6_9MICC|nr:MULTISPECIES: ArgP/LysG family DNA-binding transcriptional regulator [Kocuria]NKE10270.1 ArgP/LysG family DNA-binding transcriptional regulator [Kocuria subflava]
MEQLRTLAAVVDLGTFDRAAAQLHITAPAVSQRIKALEAQTGHVLVQRVVPVQLTEPGQEVLRLARQVLALHADTLEHLGVTEGGDDPQTAPWQLPVAVNADSLATWFRPVMAQLGGPSTVTGRPPVLMRLSVEDQDHSRKLLQAGAVAAAITTSERTVTGCRSIPLGRMVYEPCISPVLLESLGSHMDSSRTPVVVFNHKDDLQDSQLRNVPGGSNAPQHRVPSSEAFIRAVADGLGWGMVPQLQMADSPFAAVDSAFARVPGLTDETVTLYLQRWKTPLPALDRLEHSIREHARQHL